MASFIVPALITVIVFVLILFFAGRAQKDGSTRERLGRMTFEESPQPSEENYNPETDFLNSNRDKDGIASFGESIMNLTGASGSGRAKELQLNMIQAGINSPNAVGYYYAARIIGLPLAILLAWWIINIPAEGMMRLLHIVVALVVVFLGWFGPKLYVTNKKQNRQKILQRSFPDTLDLILVCVESGLALDAALARVCRELGRAHPEITKELNRTRMELTLLSDRSIALQNLATRTDLVAFRSLVAALLQTERFGTSLTETLRVLSEDYRNTRLMVAENKAGRLPAMMTVPMILLMMPAFVMIIMGPAIIQVYASLATMNN